MKYLKISSEADNIILNDINWLYFQFINKILNKFLLAEKTLFLKYLEHTVIFYYHALF